MLNKLSDSVFKMSIVGCHTCLQSLEVVFRSVVSGFLR